MSKFQWESVTLGDVTTESRKRAGNDCGLLGHPVYGVDRSIGLTSEAKYKASNLERYKLLEHGMFAYNPMRLNIGSIGYCSQKIQPGLVSPDYVVFECNSKYLDPDFLSYYIKSPLWNEWTANAGVGSVRMRIYYKELAQLPLWLPPFPEQRAIVEILGALDDKIELNRYMNRTLETMAQLMFRQWFVESIEAKGREDKPLYEYAEYINGAAYRDFDFSSDNSGLPIIKIAEIKNGITGQTKFTNKHMDEKYRINDGDILFAWSGSPDTSIDTFIWSNGEGWLNQHIFKINFPNPEQKWFTYLLLKHFKEIFIEIAHDKQTTGLGHVTVEDLKRLTFPCPPDQIIGKFTKIVGSMLDQVLANKKEARTLASLRDSLLPKLMRGEVRVREGCGGLNVPDR